MYVRGLILFVIVPTILAAFYFFLLASDKFVSEASFSVKNDKQQTGMDGGLATLVGGRSSGSNQSLIVKEFIKSREFLNQLGQIIDINKVYSGNSGDVLSRLSKNASKEDLLGYISDQIYVNYSQDSGITEVKVESFQPEHSKAIAEKTILIAERFVNSMSERIRRDSINFSEVEVENAENEVIEASDKITEFRNRNQNIDPTQTSGGILNIVSNLEAELSSKRAELDAALQYMNANSIQIKSRKQRIAALEAQVDAQNNKLAGEAKNEGDIKQSDLIREYERLQLEKGFATKRYELALVSLEQARMDSLKKSIYLLLISKPNLPDSATKPHRLKETLTVLVLCFLIYSLLVLLIASIKDHAKPNYKKKG